MEAIDRKLVLNIEQCDLIMRNNNLMLRELNEVMRSQKDDIGKNAVARCMAVVVSNSMYANDEQFRLSIETNE